MVGLLYIEACVLYNLIMIIQNIKNKIVPILQCHGVSKAALFGSVVKGEAKKRSDVDILVKFSEKKFA